VRIRDLRAGLAGAVALLLAPLASAEPLRVALLPIVVHSAEPDSAYLSAGLADMLTARLERNAEVRVVRARWADGSTADAEAALAAARNVGASYAVFGSFTHFGEGASLDVHCAQVGADGAEARRVFVQAGSLSEIIPELDGLSDRIARHLTGEPAPRPAPTPEPAPAAASPQNGYQDLLLRVEALERAVYDADLPPPGDAVEDVTTVDEAVEAP
jgi:TolB-like protein